MSTRPVDQTLAAVLLDPAARERRRTHVVAGAYRVRRSTAAPTLTIAAMGALLAAAERLTALGESVDVVCVTSPGLLFTATRAWFGSGKGESWILDAVFPADRAAPLLTILEGHPHTLAFLAGIKATSLTSTATTASTPTASSQRASSSSTDRRGSE